MIKKRLNELQSYNFS